jgi:hypothetical protein
MIFGVMMAVNIPARGQYHEYLHSGAMHRSGDDFGKPSVISWRE